MNKFNSYFLLLFLLVFIPKVSAIEIELDGVLDELFWQNANKFTTSYQVIPQTFKKSNNNFSYIYFTTKQGIYIGLSANIKSELRIRTQENDTPFSNDHFQVMLDMDNTAETSYVFAINHQGNYYDGILKQNKEVDFDWSAQWHFKTAISKTFWTAEIFIPWQSMSFNIKEKNQFGLSFIRYDEATNATYSSIPASSSMNSFLQNFSKVDTIIKSNSTFDIYPYISVNRDIVQNSNSADLGAEIFWKPTKNQQISVTLNPDFGQVESNELVVNFSAIESFNSEKRSFFNDNQDIFDVSGPETLRVVHTPRIGGSLYYQEGNESTVDSAFKYTYSNDNLDLGILSAFESSKKEESGRDLWLLRGQYSFNSNKIGVSINNVLTPSISREATIISTDFNYSYSDDTELLFGLINSNIAQDSSSISDIGWWFTGSSELNERHSHEFSMFAYGEALQLNDIGYVKRVNRKQFEYEYQYQIPVLDFGTIRDITFALETEIKTNYQHEKLPFILGGSIQLTTYEEFEYQISVEHGGQGFDDLITRGHNSLLLPAFYLVELEVSSAEYNWGSFEAQIEFGTEGFSGKFYNFESSIKQQFNDSFHLGLTFSQYSSDSWIDWDEGNIVNEFDFTEQSIAVSLDYQIDDNQELRVKFEFVIGKAIFIANYEVQANGEVIKLNEADDFSFSESALQVRYKYSISKLTAFYVSYGFGGEFEDDIAKFGDRNLYKKAIQSKNAHNLFAKIRLRF